MHAASARNVLRTIRDGRVYAKIRSSALASLPLNPSLVCHNVIVHLKSGEKIRLVGVLLGSTVAINRLVGQHARKTCVMTNVDVP